MFPRRLKSFPISVPRYHTPQTEQKSCRQSIARSLARCSSALTFFSNYFPRILSSFISFSFPSPFSFLSFLLANDSRVASRIACLSGEHGETVRRGEERKERHAFAEIQRDFPRTRSKAPTKSDLLVPPFLFIFTVTREWF